VSLPNILLDRAAQPEFLQDNSTPANLAGALERLLTDPAARAAQKADAAAAVTLLTSGGDSPSQRAARCILDLIATGAPARNG
jgi:lipid-A-disaccharide synthase